MKHSVLFLTLLALFSQSLYSAKYLYPKLYIDQIICKARNEQNDDIYFEITEVSRIGAKEKRDYYRIPRFPLFWRSNMLTKLPKQHIWNGTLQEHQKIFLYISMYEQDLPPFDPDDKIGDMILELSIENEQLQLNWQNSNSSNSDSESINSEPSKKIIFTDHKALYEVTFRISNQKDAPKQQNVFSTILEQEENVFDDPWSAAFW